MGDESSVDIDPHGIHVDKVAENGHIDGMGGEESFIAVSDCSSHVDRVVKNGQTDGRNIL
jgi:hypothetical protein